MAQGATEPITNPRACSMMEQVERLKCQERLSRNISAPIRTEGEDDSWIISETTSPVNYAPIVTATTSSREGSLTQLAIYCRGGRTELVVSGSGVSDGSAGLTIYYSINDGQQAQVAATSPLFGGGAAFTGDIVRLLQSFPEDGHIAIRVAPRAGAAQDGLFSLGGLKTVREKIAAACRWPNGVAVPR